MKRWISVKDRLPKSIDCASDYVLIYESSLGIMVGYITSIEDEPYWVLKEDRSVMGYRPLEVTHWMELPAGPSLRVKGYFSLRKNQLHKDLKSKYKIKGVFADTLGGFFPTSRKAKR